MEEHFKPIERMFLGDYDGLRFYRGCKSFILFVTRRLGIPKEIWIAYG